MSKKHKYYFCDVGIRNALIANFNDLTLRDDVGKLWENFIIMERIKTLHYLRQPCNTYFWRTWDQSEIDWIEERGGKLFAYEIKWQQKELKAPRPWLETYPEASFKVIHQHNYLDFLLAEQI